MAMALCMVALPVSLEDVQEAQTRIEGFVHKTPVLTSETFDTWAGVKLFFKCESLQKGGAFKLRGAVNAVKQLSDEQRDVVTHSSGNHAQAIAIACKLTARNAHIVMPDNAPTVKRNAVIEYGARVIPCVSTQESREATAKQVMEEISNSVFLPPYDHPHIIAGQGTVGLEILEQIKHMDAVICPVGGGGLISGVCVAIKEQRPDIKIIAAEPLRACDCADSMAKGEHVFLPSYPDTIADGLRTSMGHNNWPIIKKYVDIVMTVNEHDIIQAQRHVFERLKQVIEPSAGVPAAVAVSEEFQAYARDNGLKRVAVILCGGNQDIDKLPWVVSPDWRDLKDKK